MLHRIIVAISFAVVLLAACAEAGVDGTPTTVPNDGRPKDGALSVGIDAIQAALNKNYAGLSAEMKQSINDARVEDFVVVDSQTAVMEMRWGDGDREDPVWGVMWIGDEARLPDGSFPVELVSVSRDLTGMYAQGDDTVVVFHEAQVIGDKQVEETQNTVTLTYTGSEWQLAKKSGKDTFIVTLIDDQVKALPWGDMWVKQVQGGGNEASNQSAPTQAQPTQEAMAQAPEGLFKWDGPTLMQRDATKGAYVEYGQGVKKSKAVIDQDGNRLTLLQDQDYSTTGMPAAYKVFDADGEHTVDNETYEIGGDAWLYKQEKQEWVQLPPQRTDEEYEQMAIDNAQGWLNGDLNVEANVRFQDNGHEIPYTITPHHTPSPDDATGSFHAVLLGGLKHEGKIRLVFGVEDVSGGHHVAMVTPIQAEDTYYRFDFRISQSQDWQQAQNNSYQTLKVKPALVLRVVEQASKKPVLSHIYQITIPAEAGITCGDAEAQSGIQMIMGMLDGRYRGGYYNFPGTVDGPIPCTSGFEIHGDNLK